MWESKSHSEQRFWMGGVCAVLDATQSGGWLRHFLKNLLLFSHYVHECFALHVCMCTTCAVPCETFCILRSKRFQLFSVSFSSTLRYCVKCFVVVLRQVLLAPVRPGTCNSPPASASQKVGVTGMSNFVRFYYLLLKRSVPKGPAR